MEFHPGQIRQTWVEEPDAPAHCVAEHHTYASITLDLRDWDNRVIASSGSASISIYMHLELCPMLLVVFLGQVEREMVVKDPLYIQNSQLI